LALGAGVGNNIAGLEYSAHARLRPLVGSSDSGRLHALTFQSAISRGQYQIIGDLLNFQCDEPQYCQVGPKPQWMTWLQLDVGWETRASSGFLLRVSTGYAFALNSPNWHCTLAGKTATCKNITTSFPTLTVALGYAF